MKEVIINNTIYRYGKNASDNTQLIKDSDKNWHWFHLEKFPSCHVIICREGDLTNEEILEAGRLVKEHSRYKFNKIGINYCLIQNLIHGKEPGSVSFVSNKQVKKFNL
jgi:predicted ribosome quality control (RQC) complex YloA/Tae2 family protein